jgi:hypothetical protein
MYMAVATVVLCVAACQTPRPIDAQPTQVRDDRERDDREYDREHDRERDGEHSFARPNRASSALARRQFAEIAAAEAKREAMRAGARAQQPGAWVSLGPRTGNTGTLSPAESGMVDAIRVDPRDPRIVIVGTAGGGLWKTTDITAATPDWSPIGDHLGDLAVGSFDLDPRHPDTIIAGLGEPFYQSGGFVQVSGDGGQIWGDPVPLGAATNVRDLRIDPTDSNVVLVTTDAGLFRSTDGGAHFELIDLPNGALALQEATWSIAYTGHDASGSHWSISGVLACDVGRAPPQASGGLPPGPQCNHGNAGDIWRSVDGGLTWSSATAASALPPSYNHSGALAAPGRMTLAAGDTTDPAHTVVYAMVGNRDESHSQTVNIFRSDDGGATYSSAKGALTNPDAFCTDLDVGASQSGFNQAIAVDPANSDHVVVAGLLCSFRTLDGRGATPHWQIVSDVYGPQTATTCGSIPYVHSDFHALVISNIGGVARVLLGGDGGLETSTDALTVQSGSECSIHWDNANRGLVTHLCYSIASGDQLGGDPEVVFTGMQDISSRWRDPTDHDRWNTINQSDGIGGAVAHVGGQTIYWTSQAPSPNDDPTPDRKFCKRDPATDCDGEPPWRPSNPTLPAGDSETWSTYLAALDADPAGGVLSNTSYNAWTADATPSWTNISGRHCDPQGNCATGNFDYMINGVAASPAISGLYGLAMYDRVAVTSDGGANWTISSPLGVGPSPSQRVWGSAAAIALPPVTASGTQAGDVYVAGSSDELLADGSVIPASIGHLFVTHDRGATWTPLSGTAQPLPNVPVWSIQYDHQDANTVYVATEIGVYRTSDGGTSWERLGHDLPMVRTTDLALARDGGLLRISTWGRGVWELDLTDDGKGDGMKPGTGAGGGCCETGSGAPASSLALAIIVLVVVRLRRREHVQ